MTLTRKDAATAVLGVLVIGVYVANTHAWGFLTSNRWAAVSIGILGMAMCSLGNRYETTWSAANVTLSVLGIAALVLFVLALVFGTQVWLGALTLVTLALWVGATVHHATAGSVHRPQHTA
jgi:peptidoglycan/LPS O-acetylase OafA/YrhL